MLREAWKWVHLHPPLPNSCNAMTGHAQKVIAIQRRLCDAVDSLTFALPVTHVYNPLRYAQRPAETYLRRYLSKPKPEALFLGMNPGPWGMAQSGVPFGDVTLVRDWMAIDIDVDRPPNEHSKKPVCGAACHRREVSGQRFWGWAKSRFRNRPFLEVHHVKRLAKGGADVPSNTVALCPNCHRAAHYGAQRTIQKKLRRVLTQLETSCG